MKKMKFTVLSVLVIIAFALSVNAQINEDFETDPPTGWGFFQSQGDDPGFIQTTNRVHGGSFAFYHNDDNVLLESDAWMVSPVYTCGANDELRFWYNQDYTGDYYNYSGVWISTASGDPITNPVDFTEIQELNASAPGGFSEDTWTEFVYNLSVYSGQTIYIAFKYTGDLEHELYIDDFSLSAELTCSNPESLTVSNVYETSADLAWTETGTATTWNVEVVASGSTPSGVATATGITLNSYNCTGLTPATNYDFYVQSDCSGGDLSGWVGPYSFTTLACALSDMCYFVFEMTDTYSGNDGWSGSPDYSSVNVYQEGDFVSNITLPDGVNSGLDSVLLCEGASIQLEWEDGQYPEECGLIIYYPYGDEVYSFTAGNSPAEGIFHTFSAACEEPCWEPTGLNVLAIESDNVEVEWVTGGASNWNIEYGPAGYTPGTGTFMSNVTNPYIITGLNADTEYDFYVQDSCGVGYVSNWSGPGTFTTAPSCPQPTAVSVDNILNVSADISWITGGAANWNIEYGLAGFTLGTGTFVEDVTNPYTITGLLAQTQYDVYVQDSCGVGDLSGWVGPYSFTTLACPPSDMCYFVFEMTDTYSGNDGWWGSPEYSSVNVYQEGELVSNITLPNGVNSGQDSVLLCEGAFIQLEWIDGQYPEECGLAIYYPYGDVVYSFTAGNSPAEGIFHTFPAACEEPDCPEPTDLNILAIESDNVEVEWITGGAANWNIEYGPAGYTLGTGTFMSNVTNPYIITGLNADTEYDFYVQDSCGVGDVSYWSGPGTFTSAPSCPQPTAVSVDNILTVSADVSWITGGAANWNIEYGLAGFTLGTGTFAADVTNPYTITGLLAQTQYDVYIQDSCGTGDVSLWSGPFTFTTDCDIFVAPFIEEFTTSVQPVCWDTYSGSMEANELWKFTGSGDYGAASNGKPSGSYAWVDGSSPNTATDVTMTTPWIDLTTLSSPQIVFEVFSNNLVDANDNMTLYVDVNDGNSWNNIYTHAESDPDWIPVTIPLFAYIDDTVKVRFVVDQTTAVTPYDNDILVDSVVINDGPSCPPPYELTVDDVSHNTAIVSWYTYESAFFNIEYGPSGYVPGTGTFLANVSNPATIIGLTPETSYDFYVQDSCATDDVSTWTGAGTFMTIPSCLQPFALSVDSISDTTAVLSWIAGGATMWNIEYGPAGFTPGSGTFVSEIIENTFTINGLTPEFTYDFYVQDSCTNDDVSYWTGPVDFTTTSTCPVPSDLDVIDITDISADISWNGYFADTWDIEILDGGATPTGVPTVEDVNSNIYSMTNLTELSSYDVYIKADCGTESSEWAGPLHVNTAMTPLSNPTDCNINIAIPDNACLDIPIVVSEVGSTLGTDIILTDLNLIIEHTYDADLDITLTSPSGVTIDIIQDNGGSGNNFGISNGNCTQYTNFNMSGVDGNVSSGVSPFFGSYIPLGDFTAFDDGSDPNGIWTITICDDASGDVGQLIYAELGFGLLVPDLAIVDPLDGDFRACDLTATEEIILTIQNQSLVDIVAGEEINVQYQINGETPVAELLVLTEDLNPGENVDFIFSQTYDMSDYDIFTYVFDIDYINDVNPANDIVNGSIEHIELYVNIDGDVNDTIWVYNYNFPYSLSTVDTYDYYYWENWDASETGTNATFDVLTEGWYFVNVANNNTDCDPIDSVYVAQIPILDVDLAIIDCNLGEGTTCTLTDNESVSLEFLNGGNNIIASGEQINFYYDFNGIQEMETFILPSDLTPGSSLSYTFVQSADLSAIDTYEWMVWIDYVNDENADNDSVAGVTDHIYFNVEIEEVVNDTLWVYDFELPLNLNTVEPADEYLWENETNLETGTTASFEATTFGWYNVSGMLSGTDCQEIDSVFIAEIIPTNLDLAISNPVEGSVIQGCEMGDESIAITITNTGDDPIPDGTIITCIYNDGSTDVTESFTLSEVLWPTETADYTFLQTYDFSTLGFYNFTYSINYTDDSDATNNVISNTVQHLIYELDLNTVNATANDTLMVPYGGGTIDAGAEFESYMWFTGESTQTIFVDVDSTWAVVEVYNVTGCYDIDSIFVYFNEQPEFSFDVEYCPNETPDVLPAMSDNGFIGTWLPAEIETAVAGTSDYVFTPFSGQLANPRTITVTINELPIVICPDSFTHTENVPLTLSGATPEGGEYSGTGVTAGVFDPESLTNDIYEITYTYQDVLTGCENYCLFDITVDIDPLISYIDVNNDVDEVDVCLGTEESDALAELVSQITISDTYLGEHIVDLSWSIDSYDGNTVGIYTATGTFELPEGVDQTDPETTLEVTTQVAVNNLPPVVCPETINIGVNNPIVLSGASPEGGEYSGTGVDAGEFNPDGLSNDNYVITYTYIDPVTGCTGSCEFDVIVDIGSGIRPQLADEIKIYPNPTNGILTIELAQTTQDFIKIEVINSLGQVITVGEITDSKFELDISNEKEGLYLVIISNELEVVEYKIIKQ